MANYEWKQLTRGMVLIHAPEIKKYKHLNSLMNRHKSNENPNNLKDTNIRLFRDDYHIVLCFEISI